MEPNVLLIYGTTNIHLGLWNDLKNDNRVILRTTQLRVSSTPGKLLYRFFRYFDHFIKTSFKHLFFQYNDIFKQVNNINHLVIIDGALRTINIKELIKCKKINPHVKIYLYLLNSMEAQSPLMRGVRPKINQYKWDVIYTFDAKDAEKYGYVYLGFNYYSNHQLSLPLSSTSSDVFFVGGLKGGRTNLINDLYNHFILKNLKCDFYLMPFGNEPVAQLPGIYYYRGWRPYEDILEHVQQTNCIIEIMQEGQTGATLRFFEAVCMNKKLLTNNSNIVSFPFYNPQWMKIFKSIDDIDIDWIKKEEKVDYNYKNEFSPIYFIDFLLK